jgi:large-conductance mechanosensitive channel
MKSLREWFFHAKTRLPANGDWIFVTGDLPGDSPEDPANPEEPFIDVGSVRSSLYSNDPDLIKLVYERAKAYEATISNYTNRVYDKAKTLVGSVSFVSAVLSALVSLLLSSASRFGWIVIAIESSILFLMVGHLLRSVSIGLRVITREDLYYTHYNEVLAAASIGQDGLVNAYKDAISQIVSYADRTHEQAWQRVRKLILGQAAFHYGIFFFVLFVAFHLIALALFAKEPAKDPVNKLVELQEKALASSSSEHAELVKAIRDLTFQLSESHKDNSALIEQLKEVQKKIVEVQLNSQPASK